MKFALIFFIIFTSWVLNTQGSTTPDISSTTSIESSQSTEAPQSTASSDIPHSTNSVASNGPTQNPTEITTVAPDVPTTNSPLTTQGDTWAEFDIDCNATENYCTYRINAPQLDAGTFNDDRAKFETDEQEFNKASSIAAYDNSRFLADQVYQSYQIAKEEFRNLTLEMQSLNDTIYETLENVKNQTASINEALQNIKTIYSKLTNCYYQKCALVTPPPITTTTTLRPTTPNLCSSTKCTYDNYNGKCYVISGKPICQCPGNLDQNNECKSAGCYSNPTAYKDGLIGPFFSPNYTRELEKSYGSNLACSYKISSDKTIKITVNKFKIDASTKIYVNTKPVPYTMTKDQLQTYLNSIIKQNTKVLTVSFKSGIVPSTNGPYLIDWEIENIQN